MDVEITIENRVPDLEAARRRLGDSGHVRRVMGGVLDEAVRIGEHSARLYAPELTGRLKRKIGSDQASEHADGAMEARVGVRQVTDLPGGRAGPLLEGQSRYPLFVEQGTGLFGPVQRLITPKRAQVMRFVGKTGLVHAKTVRGQRAQPYMREARDDVDAFIRGRTDLMVREILDTDL